MFAALVAVGLAVAYAKSNTQDASLPSNTVFIDRSALAVLGNNNSSGLFRTPDQLFNPTNISEPHFQIFDASFLNVLGDKPSLTLIKKNDSFAFAHEAPVWVHDDKGTNEVWFASNDGGPLGMSDIDHNNIVSRVDLSKAESTPAGNFTVTQVPITPEIEMTNGGTPFKGKILFVDSGRGDLPPTLALVDTKPPFKSQVILDNYLGRQFNSLNDAKIHPKSKKVFFTDAPYGFLNHFRPALASPNQVYRFDPDTGDVRVVADGFDKCNGILFTPDGKTAYIADTGASGGFLGNNHTEPATIYAFEVLEKTQAFSDRRVFAYVDAGVPDGLQIDSKGNVYAGCGDGVQVFAPSGKLIGKIFLGTTSANMVFAGNGRLVVLAETSLWLVRFAANGVNLDL